MIVVAGESLIDLVPEHRTGDVLAPLLPRRGGGPYNTAVALGRLGERTGFCSRVSRDAFGESLLDGLRESAADLSLVQRGPEPTTLALVSLDAGGSAGFGFWAEGSADRLFRLPPALPEDVRALVFGTLSLVLEPGASAYEALLHREAGRGLFTLLDPNIRAGLIADDGAYRARFRSWLPSVTVLKVSEQDAAWLGGSPRDWLAAGPAAVVLTRGADGLTVVTAGGTEVSVPAAPVDVVDTIGAGDTVNAALLHALAAHGALTVAALPRLGEDTWRAVLSLAAAAAAVTCSRPGADPPYLAELTG